ncbi:MAG: TonB-dependent receptor [Bacteroidaceae bacterium]|nr:TonB-dependent receptor [Bacteroidaceae bacterium]
MKHQLLLPLLWVAITATAQEPADTTKQKNILLNEVVVTGARAQTDIRHLPMTVSVIGKTLLNEQNRPSVLPTVAEQVPGLFVTSRGMMGYGLSGGGSGGINIRGLGSGEGRIMVLIDGHPQYSGIYGHSISDSYQTMMAEKVEVLRGPASVIYGSNAMGGVINIVTHGQREDGVYTSLNLGAGSWGTFQSQISNTVQRNGFSSNVSVQYNRSDNHRPHMGFEQYGGHVNLGYDFNTHWRVFADADLTHFNASHPGTTDKPMLEADQWITRGVVNAGLENSFGSTSGAVTVYSNFGRHKINDGYEIDGGTPQNRLFRSKDALTGLSFYQSFSLFTGNRVTAGLDWQHIYGRAYYTSRETGEVIETPNKQSGKKHMNEVAGYVNLHQDVNEWLTLDAGLRYNHHSVVGSEWIPQGGVVIRPMSSAELKATIGKGFRNPTLREMYLYPPSNEELKPERIVNHELSWKHRVADNRVQYGINVFYIQGDNLIQTINRQNVNMGKIKNWGAEVEAAWRINGRWQIQTNHSLLRMKYPIVASPKYKGYLSASYTTNRWRVNVGLQQVSGLYTAVGENPTTEHFTLLNASVSFRPAKPVELWLRGENLLAQRYEINAGYPMPRATFMSGVHVHF